MSFSINKILQNKILKQSLITFGLRCFGIAFLFGITLIMTRNFEPTLVGQYEFTRTFLLILGSICLIGTDVSIIYFAGKLKANNSFHRIKNVYFSILKIILLISAIIIACFFLFFNSSNINAFFNEDIYSLIFKCFIFLPFYILSIFNTETLRALDKPIISELFRNIFKYFPLTIGIIILLNGNYVYSLSDFYIYGFLPLFIITQTLTLYFLSTIKGKDNSSYSVTKKEIIYQSFPMGISNIIMFLLLGVDVFLLKKYYGNETVAFYAVAVKLITILSMVILSVNINCSPKISELFTLNKKEELQSICKKTARLTFGANVIVALFLILLINPILNFFGELYVYIENTFYILIISQIFTSAFGVIPVYLNMTGRSKIFQSILLITLFLNIVFNIFLIPSYSTIGAAITFSFSVIFWNVIVFLYAYKKDGINLFFI